MNEETVDQEPQKQHEGPQQEQERNLRAARRIPASRPESAEIPPRASGREISQSSYSFKLQKALRVWMGRSRSGDSRSASASTSQPASPWLLGPVYLSPLPHALLPGLQEVPAGQAAVQSLARVTLPTGKPTIAQEVSDEHPPPTLQWEQALALLSTLTVAEVSYSGSLPPSLVYCRAAFLGYFKRNFTIFLSVRQLPWSLSCPCVETQHDRQEDEVLDQTDTLYEYL